VGSVKGAKTALDLFGDAALYAFHKLTEQNLRHADKMGGLPMPSVGVGRLDVPVEGYGDITLVGTPDMAKPSARNPVYSADAYSPTYPSITYRHDRAKVDDLAEQLSPYTQKTGERALYVNDLEDGARNFGFRKDVAAKYLTERGVELPDLDGRELDRWMRKKINDSETRADFDNYVQAAFDALEPEERIFWGFTNSGNRQYKPHTLDNAMKYMRREMKDNNQTSMFGAGAFRAQVAPKFRNITDVKNARDRILPADALNEVKDPLNEGLAEASQAFSDYSTFTDRNPFIAADVDRERLLEIAKGQATYDEYFPGAPQEIIDRWEQYLKKLKEAPTGYFEAKPNRSVSLGEFPGALIPQSASAEVEDILRRNGVQRIVRFVDEEDKKEKLKSFSDLLFSAPAVGAVGLGAATQSDESEAGVITKGGRRILEAFHGTPHRFPPIREIKLQDGTRLFQNLEESTSLPEGARVVRDLPLGRFDMSKVGTGEGAQAYGHGLYFADSEDVARGYREALTSDPDIIRSKFSAFNDALNTVGLDYRAHGIDDDMLLHLMEEIQYNKGDLAAVASYARKTHRRTRMFSFALQTFLMMLLERAYQVLMCRMVASTAST